MRQAEPDIRALAQQQLADYDAHRPGLIFAGGADFLNVAQAYALQLEVARLRQARGEMLAGFKVGCVSEAIRRQFGLDRAVFGHVWASEIHPNGVALDSAHFADLAIEGEFAFRLAEDIPSVEALSDEPTRFLASAEVLIELHNYLFRAQPPTAQELVANNALHAGVVLSAEPPHNCPPEQLLDEKVSVFRNGELLGTATGQALPGGPLGSLAQLTEHLALHGIRLRRGQLVLTGSPLPLYRVSAGDHIQVRGARLPGVWMTVK
jgi:2-keto-4-pentenoate hydratase